MKQIYISLLAVISLAFLNMSCQNNSSADTNNNNATTFDTTVLRKIIVEKTNHFAKAHVLRDTAFLNNIFTQGARVFAPNSEAVTGRSAISAINSEFVNLGINEARIEVASLYGGGDYLISEGNYTMSYGKENTTEKGKYIYVWKKVAGDWKLDVDMWNSSMPINSAK